MPFSFLFHLEDQGFGGAAWSVRAYSLFFCNACYLSFAFL